MALSVLSQASALNPGSDLWIVPDLEKSQWTAKLDWYLNFQVCKSSRHVAPAISHFLDHVLTETELQNQTFQTEKSAPLMIASSELLPNKWVVIVPWQNDLNQWTTDIYKVWKNLNKPSIRIFLPTAQSSGALQLAWQKHGDVLDFSVVLD